MIKPLRLMLASAGFLACFAVLASPALAGPGSYYVAPNGSGVECTETAPCGLEKAVEEAVNEDSIVVEPGTYALAGELALRSVDIGGQLGAAVPVIETQGHSVRAAADRAPHFHDLRVEGSGGFSLNEGSAERVFVSYTGASHACGLTDGGSLVDTVCWAHGGGESAVAVEVQASNEDVTATLRNVTAIDANATAEALHTRTIGVGPKLVVNGTNVIVRAEHHADIELETGGSDFPVTEVDLNHSSFSTVVGEEAPFATVTPLGANGNQSAPPTFANLAGGDFRETFGSPTIGAGLTDPLNGLYGLAGEPRVFAACGGAPATDTGAYEFVATAECPVPAPGPTPTPVSGQLKLGKLKLNRQKGTATLSVNVSAAGQVTLSGAKVKKATKSAKGAVTLSLPVGAIGKAAKKLSSAGKAKLKLSVRFAPTTGAAVAQSKSVTLVEKIARASH